VDKILLIFILLFLKIDSIAQTKMTDKKNTKTNENIEKFGWEIILIKGTKYFPSFGYTIGLTKNYNHPEIICFGLSIETLHAIINDAGELVKSGQNIEIGKDYLDFFENGKSQFITVHQNSLSDYFGTAFEYYDTTKFSAIQLVWTDTKNKLPWEIGFEAKYKFKQPLLDRNMDFKFGEEKNLAIFTTKQFLDLNEPILYVVHDKNGDWQFLTGGTISSKDAKIVSLGQIVSKDLTLNEVFDLDYGERAERDKIGGHWKRK
jgi:hypothetical protein